MNSPFEFLRAFHRSLVEMQRNIEEHIISYMDDLILLNKDEISHERDLKKVLTILERDGWQLIGAKRKFEQEIFDYLGIALRQNG